MVEAMTWRQDGRHVAAADDIVAFAGGTTLRCSSQRGINAAPHLGEQLIQQRIDELQQQRNGGLSEAHKQKLRGLPHAQRR